MSSGVGGIQISNNMVQVDAFGVTAQSVTANYTIDHNCIDLNNQVIPGPNPTIAGIVIAGAVTGAVINDDDNNITDGFYGHVVYGANTTTAVNISNGSVSGSLQGVAIVNTLGGPLAGSNVQVNNMNLHSFAGNHPSMPAVNFHAGVYAFTAATSNSGNGINLSITGTTIDGTQSITQSSAAIYLADFSGASSPVQNVTVDENTITNNANRGVDARGQVSATVTESSFMNNGGSAFGTGGNNGFTFIAQQGASISATNNFIVHPASSSTSVTAFLTGNGSGNSIVASDNSVLMNGNALEVLLQILPEIP
ncbi:MAG: hypothetical protein HWD58_06105 [Bacteroidota bacterium]|nr:MAG: hypothetical protein HWD58_06105 [Bacteroidota bacterium]